MNKEEKKYIDDALLERLCRCSAPSSREMELQEELSSEFLAMGIACHGDAIGNLYAQLNPKSETQIALVAHADEIGLQITHINEHGLLRYRKIGGLRCTSLFGHRVRILTDKGFVHGIVGSDPLQKNETDNGILVRTSDQWIDIGASSKEDANQMVHIGDFAVFEPDYMRIGAHRIVSKALDDRVGTYVMLQVMRELQYLNLHVGITAISSVQEEISMRGIQSCRLPFNAAIVIDVDFATDAPTTDSDMGLLKLGYGVGINLNADSNPVMIRHFRQVVEEAGLPYQKTLSRNLSGGTDATKLQVGCNAATLNINIPLRYMHTHSEVCDERDVDCAVKSIVGLLTHLDKNRIIDFVPWQKQ